MVYLVFLVITCVLQLFAAVVAIRLTRVTKYNFSWMLISAGLVMLSFRCVVDLIYNLLPEHNWSQRLETPYAWVGIGVSLCFAIGVFMIQKIFVYIRVVDIQKRNYEKRLLNAIIMAEENERKRFATDLHDGLGPLLSSIRMGFSAISDEITDTEIKKNLEHAISEAITTVREVSNNLSPHILNNFGLDKAIRNFVYRLTLPPEMHIDYSIGIGENRYDSTIEIVIYRVLCELMHNTMKHAEATEIKFSLVDDGSTLVLNYSDNGKGFHPDVASLDCGSGMGYYNIISRVTSLKGTIAYGDESTQGTNVEVKIPNDVN